MTIMKKSIAVLATLAVGFGTVACTDAEEDTSRNTSESTNRDNADDRDDRDDRDDNGNNASANTNRGDIPTEATSFTPEAQRDLQEERVTEEEVNQLLANITNQTDIEFDDGYWEIDNGPLSIDIHPDGTVTDVDRDDDNWDDDRDDHDDDDWDDHDDDWDDDRDDDDDWDDDWDD